MVSQRWVQRLNDKTWILHFLGGGRTYTLCKKIGANMFDRDAVSMGI